MLTIVVISDGSPDDAAAAAALAYNSGCKVRMTDVTGKELATLSVADIPAGEPTPEPAPAVEPVEPVVPSEGEVVDAPTV